MAPLNPDPRDYMLGASDATALFSAAHANWVWSIGEAVQSDTIQYKETEYIQL